MSITQAFKLFWERWLDYYGTSSRKEFWKAIFAWFLIIIIFIVALSVAVTNFGISINFNRLKIVLYILSFIVWIPGIALLQRRLNDTGMSRMTASALVWIYVILSFLSSVSIIGLINGAFGIVLLILCILPTDYYN